MELETRRDIGCHLMILFSLRYNYNLRLFVDMKDRKMLRKCALTLAFVFISTLSNAQDSLDDQTRALIARAASLELKTKSVPPPGNPLEHHASGFAKVLCSAVFVTGLDPDFAAENIGYFTAPYEERAKMKWRVDRKNKAVHVTLPNGVTRTAKFIGDLGCLTLPRGENSPFFEPTNIESRLPDATTTKWPMGDVLPGGELPADLMRPSWRKQSTLLLSPRTL